MITQPIFFQRNRVFRVYTGGKLFSEFFGDNSTDGHYPEEWIASAVGARNTDGNEDEGFSIVKDSGERFDKFLSENKEQALGVHESLGFLVKALDSAIRLPVQAHPDKEFSRKYFNSQYGKAESWIVLETRPHAKLYFGFKQGVTKEQFVAAIEKSETDKTAMENLIEQIPVSKGDTFFIPAKAVHAIGYGCLILEIQEPTDFTIQPEAWCGDYHLSQDEMYMGLSQEVSMECFDFELKYNPKITPITLSENGVLYEQLIGPQQTDCFGVNRIKLENTKFTLQKAPGVYVVTDGSGQVCGKTLKKGDYFFVPYCLAQKCEVSTTGQIELVECFKKQEEC